jgi:hypothetical protein
MNRVVRGRSRLFFAARGATRPDDALVNQSKNGAGRISARGKMKKQIFFLQFYIESNFASHRDSPEFGCAPVFRHGVDVVSVLEYPASVTVEPQA